MGKVLQLSEPLVDPKKYCSRCKYHHVDSTTFYCGYLAHTGRTRTGLHPEGLTSDCKEFEPKKRGRPKKEVT